MDHLQDGWLWETIHDGLPWLLTVVCLLIASLRYATTTAATTATTTTTTSILSASTPGQKKNERKVPTLDGHKLYYGKTRWPQYEARFNLRLSYVYGPVITVKLGATGPLGKFRCWLNRCLVPGWRPADTTVVINSLAEDDGTLRRLLNSCASRAFSIPAGKYLAGGRRIVLQPYGSDWQRHRRAFASLLTKEKTKNLWSRAVRFEALVMVDRLARLISAEKEAVSDIRLLKEVTRFTASNVLQIAYARRAESPDDLVLGELTVVSQNIASAFTPGKYLVESLPMLDWFPAFMSPWKRKLIRDHEFEKGLFTRLVQDVDTELQANQGQSGSVISVDECAAAQLLKNSSSLQLDRDDIAYLAAGLFEAGTETTAMTIDTFLLAAACHPEITRQAQQAIDEYLEDQHGQQDIVPTFEDLQKIEYLGAVVKESLRLTPTGSSGVGHMPHTFSTVQSLYLKREGEDLPTQLDVAPDATILGNIYGLHHDTKLFPDPWKFNPTRWLVSSKENGNALDYSHRNAHYFGFGRRICPGATLVSYTLPMAIALLILCFDFELTAKAKDICAQMDSLNEKELEQWNTLYPLVGGEKRGRHSEDQGKRSGCDDDENDNIGRVLLDSHITFNLSKDQLAECIRLKTRSHGGDRLRAVRDTLAKMQEQYSTHVRS